MSHSIEEVRYWPEGDTRIFPFVITDEDSEDDRVNISGAEITWKLYDNVSKEDVLSIEDEGVSIEIISESSGEFEIHIDKEATNDLTGRFREIIRVTDAEGNRTTWKSKVRISKVE